ncbi:hypothetical protein KAR91_17070 [Candidatus Pacearchaeota archaeon]|nr:hypothetical protein [Candidatus Pacearchaeota archaeon]
MYHHEAHDYESIVQEVMKLDTVDEEKETTQSDFINKYLNNKPGMWILISVTSESVLKKDKTHTVFHFFWSIRE